MHSKKNIIIFILLIVSISIIGIGSIVIASSPYTQIGFELKKIGNNDTVLASVNGLIITQNDVDKTRAGLLVMEEISKQTGDNIKFLKSDEEIIDSLIEKRILYLKSIEEGANISGDDLSQYLQKTIELLQNASSNDIGAQAAKEYASGLGLSIEEYINNNAFVYEIQLSNNSLRLKYVGDIDNIEEADLKWNIISADIIAQYSSKVEKFIPELSETAASETSE
jgi:hypothetical protein